MARRLAEANVRHDKTHRRLSVRVVVASQTGSARQWEYT